MKRVVMIFLITQLVSCALTSPNGSKELLDDIKKDQQNKYYQERKSLIGKPVFLKVRAYSQIEDGNIHGKHWILLQVDREKLDLTEIMESLEE